MISGRTRMETEACVTHSAFPTAHYPKHEYWSTICNPGDLHFQLYNQSASTYLILTDGKECCGKYVGHGFFLKYDTQMPVTGEQTEIEKKSK